MTTTTPTLADVTATALRLPEGERAALVDALLDSLPDECPEGVLSTDDPGYEAEIARRVEAVRNGTAELMSMDEAMRYIMSDDEDDDANG